ncbi:MAG: TIGR04551 family protein, partial [Polyangiales bacterium]
AATAHATGFTDVGEDLHARDKTEVSVDGYFRTRAEYLYNLDLDRGLTPSGQALFPVPLDSPRGQALSGADMRLRTDVSIYAPGESVAVKARLDWIDDVSMGSVPVSSAQPTGAAVNVKRAWGEVRTPIGMLAAGRMGSSWGLGILANGGDCLDCDGGDAADRVAFVTPLLGHIFAVAYDFGSVSPTAYQKDGLRSIGLAPSTGANTLTIAALRYHTPSSLVRRNTAGLATLDYGAYFSYRSQLRDSATTEAPASGAALLGRGLTASAFDMWARFVTRWVRVEIEAVYLSARVEDASMIPGVHYRTPVTSSQLGAALESEIAEPTGAYGLGVDTGYASGDQAPGFGAYPASNAHPQSGDLDGLQANPPRDTTVDNFRFHPDYRIDRILFREIIGLVTDAVYVRPHARVRLYDSAPSSVTFSAAAIASWAVYATSTPGLQHPLGLEIDPTLTYATRDGLLFALEYAVLFPWSGLDNPQLGLAAKPAQSWRARMVLRF